MTPALCAADVPPICPTMSSSAVKWLFPPMSVLSVFWSVWLLSMSVRFVVDLA